MPALPASLALVCEFQLFQFLSLSYITRDVHVFVFSILSNKFC